MTDRPLPATAAAGTYGIVVHVTTNPGATASTWYDARAATTYQIGP